MSQAIYRIDRIEKKNSTTSLCYFESDMYRDIPFGEQVVPMERLLSDSDRNELIYIVQSDQKWHYIGFPSSTWPTLDKVLVEKRELFLVVSVTEEGHPARSIPLTNFRQECVDLISNVLHNANYGPTFPKMIETSFKETISQLLD